MHLPAGAPRAGAGNAVDIIFSVTHYWYIALVGRDLPGQSATLYTSIEKQCTLCPLRTDIAGGAC